MHSFIRTYPKVNVFLKELFSILKYPESPENLKSIDFDVSMHLSDIFFSCCRHCPTGFGNYNHCGSGFLREEK